MSGDTGIAGRAAAVAVIEYADRLDGQDDDVVTAENMTKAINEIDRRDKVDAQGKGDGHLQFDMVPHAIVSARSSQRYDGGIMKQFNDLKPQRTSLYLTESLVRSILAANVEKGTYTLKA